MPAILPSAPGAKRYAWLSARARFAVYKLKLAAADVTSIIPLVPKRIVIWPGHLLRAAIRIFLLPPRFLHGVGVELDCRHIPGIDVPHLGQVPVADKQ